MLYHLCVDTLEVRGSLKKSTVLISNRNSYELWIKGVKFIMIQGFVLSN